MLTITQYAKLTGKFRQFIHLMIKNGRLPATRIGSQWVIPDGAKISPPVSKR